MTISDVGGWIALLLFNFWWLWLPLMIAYTLRRPGR